MEPQNELCLGSLLKDERERKGLSRDQVARITRLRIRFLEALENEEWGNLPSPVFVKGFIRSYAQAVGFDGKEAIRLYERIVPFEEELPNPLVGPKESSRKTVFIIIIPLIAVLAALIYLWIGYNTHFFIENKEHVSARQAEVKQPSVLPEPEKDPEQVVPQDPSPNNRDLDADPEEEHEFKELPAEKELPGPPVEETPIVPTTESAPVIEGLVLTAIVNMRTYIKIYVDDNLPKEYIFQPGSRPQWTAVRGFDILVGNAAGIEFVFNGKRISVPGGLGKVIRVKLPEDFESSIGGD
ncbi:RodZ domain-containing protein [Thermodesulfobacteriota bacterium]